ncbi:MAG: hypothetical protein ABJF23_33020 [Bryobacteraceae bacterium]
MMHRVLLVAAVLWLLPAAAGQTAEARRITVERIRQEADRFVETASRIEGKETLTQSQPARTQREIVSEYGFLSLRPGEIREIRQVELVDGKRAKKRGNALRDLAANLTAAGDEQRRKLLLDFEKHGLQGVAAGFGPVIQMFSTPKMQNFEFIFQEMEKLNGTPVAVYRYEQIDGAGGLTIFSGGKPIRQKLRGEVWVLPADGTPARIVLDSEFEEGKSKLRDLTLVDYGRSEFGTLLPVIVVHRQFRDRTVLVQDLFRYTEYHRLP